MSKDVHFGKEEGVYVYTDTETTLDGQSWQLPANCFVALLYKTSLQILSISLHLSVP